MKYFAHIKEKMIDSILKPSLNNTGYKPVEYLIKFWGLNEPDIEWYDLYMVGDDGVVKKIASKH